MKTVIKIFLTVSLFAIALHAQAPTSEVVVNKMIEAYGGEKSIMQLNNYEQFWHIETKTRDTNGTDTRAVHMPILLRTELVYPHKTEVRTLINDYGTKQFGQKKVQAEGAMLDAMKLQLMRLFHPLVLKEKLGDITLSETSEHYVLDLKAGSISAEYFVSKKSYLIEKVVGHLKMGSQGMEFLTLYEDYTSLNGVMLPRKEVKYAGSVNTAVMRLQKMTFTAPPQKHR
ncbi:MAG: hypothetical protein ABFR02_07150 [Campylobacterota bacterium]